jgi:GNAT superfamily N-acetyltransferase
MRRRRRFDPNEPPPLTTPVAYAWRGSLESEELERLHAEAFAHPPRPHDWRARLDRHSLGWLTARDEADALIGFVNLAWDGGAHAFLLDLIVALAWQRQGIGRTLVIEATAHARAAGCNWLHVDFVPELRRFYVEAPDFRATEAALIRL